MSPTAPPAAQAGIISEFELMSLEPGQTVMVTTADGTYYITATANLRRPRREDALVWGISVMADKPGLFQLPPHHSPYNVRVAWRLMVGQVLALTGAPDAGTILAIQRQA